MVRFVVINNSPLVKVMRPVTAKVTVSPGAALAMAWRSEPGPSSAVVLTTAAHPYWGRSRAMTANRNAIDLFIVGLPFSVPWCVLRRNVPISNGRIYRL
jgi:hypothetical protein